MSFDSSSARSQSNGAFFLNANGGGSKIPRKEIYKIPESGWTSPKWNWGYASGTGHDCAMICRERWNSRETRADLVNTLLNPPSIDESLTIQEIDSFRDPPFEEIKLILALAWQRGRWDGTDGGVGGYGEVLSTMAEAKKYESEDEDASSQLLVQDMIDRFHLISSSSVLKEMDVLTMNCGDTDTLRRKCTGLVLREMGFIANGL